MEYIAQARRDDYVKVSEYCPERPYVEVQIPENVTHVERIIVNITSNDQGFCSDESLIGKHGYTWFEANILTPSGRNNIPRRLLARNIAGKGAGKQFHKVLLQNFAPGDETSQFLEEIRGGDIIQIFPKARWQGWVNNVHSMELEVNGKTQKPEERDHSTDVRPSYAPLDRSQKSIRLLVVHPGSGIDPVSCELLLSNFLEEKHAEYEALSYCWGNNRERKTIELHQPNEAPKLVHVTPALQGALSHLRNASTTRIIWVDAICINQSDAVECADQVGMMGQIYTRAKHVIVWLGEGNKETERAASTLRNLFAHYRAPTEEELLQGSSRGSFASFQSVREYEDHVQQGITNENVASVIHQMSRFFALAWFWRVWVVQEAWLSRKAIFLCGDDQIEWDSIWKANVWMNITGFSMPEFEQKTLPLIWTSLTKLQELSEHGESPTSLRLGLLDLVIQGLDLKATDPRDKIFGLLGLADETHSGQISAEDSLIYPSYTKSVSNVFSDFTRWWIQKHKSLRILSAIHATQGRTWQSLDCISGSPIHSRDAPPAEHSSWALWHSGKSKWASEALGFHASYRATGDREALSIGISGDETSRLQLRGIRIGIISNIRPFIWGDNEDELCRVYNRLFDASGARRIWNNPVSSGLRLNEEGWDDVDKHYSVHYGEYDDED